LSDIGRVIDDVIDKNPDAAYFIINGQAVCMTSVPKNDPGAKIMTPVPKKTATHQTSRYLPTGNYCRW
jgi:hypothetical protein